jgi:hypothetical protein
VRHPEGHETTVAMPDHDHALHSKTVEHALEALRLENLGPLRAHRCGFPEEYEIRDEEIEMLSQRADLVIPSRLAIGTETVNEEESRPFFLCVWILTLQDPAMKVGAIVQLDLLRLEALRDPASSLPLLDEFYNTESKQSSHFDRQSMASEK